MRYTHFLTRSLDTDAILLMPFLAEHYTQAGISYSPAIGMPVLEAYELVNRLNISQGEQRTVYALPVSC